MDRRTVIYTPHDVPRIEPPVKPLESRRIRHGMTFEMEINHAITLDEKLGGVRVAETAKEWARAFRFPNLKTGRAVVEPWLLRFGAANLDDVAMYCVAKDYATAVPSEGLEILQGADRGSLQDVGAIMFVGQTYMDGNRFRGLLCVRECSASKRLLDVEYPHMLQKTGHWWALAYKQIRTLQ